MKTPLLTLFALLAFAGNSILCRLALDHHQMDAGSFTAIRLFSGALCLFLLLTLGNKIRLTRSHFNSQSFKAGFYLFAYAACFSFAYIQLDTATGALVLFATVQLTMLAYQVVTLRSLSQNELFGMCIALFGFAYWMWPDESQPAFTGIILMVLSGIAWGFYTLNGKNTKKPQQDTTTNFITSLPFTLILIPLSIFYPNEGEIEFSGIMLAISSGAFTSGLGYWIWYSVLPNLKITLASVLQLTVPIIATLGGILWVNEWPELDFYIASVLILCGIYLVNRKTA